MNTLINQLRFIDMINFIDEDTLTYQLSSGGIILRTYPKNQIIHHQMDACTSLDIILEGRLTINRYNVDGNTVHITQFNKGDSLGGNLLFSTNNMYPFDISAIEETRLLQITKETVIEFLEQDRQFLLSFLEDLSDKAKILTHIINTLSERTLRQKITQFIDKEVALQHSKVIHLTITKKLLAERFGVARTSLSRELKSMQDEGLIEMHHKMIYVHY